MKLRLILAAIFTGLFFSTTFSRAQQASPASVTNASAAPSILPGKGLAQHDFLYAGEAKTRDIFIIRKGVVAWSYHDTTNRGEISDAMRLSNGNILFAHQFGIKLITPEQKILWQYEPPTNCETHTAQAIGANHLYYIQNGPEPKLVVVNIPENRTIKEFPLPVGNTKSTHGQFRHARLTEAGTVLVAHMDMRKVCEYDENGKQVWSVEFPSPWAAERLKNGNTLISSSKLIREVTTTGEKVWEFSPADVPDYKIAGFQIATRLPNGNTLVNNWVNQWQTTIDPDTAPVQGLELTPDKKVVWALRSWTSPNLGPGTTIQLLDDPGVPEAVHFGSIK